MQINTKIGAIAMAITLQPKPEAAAKLAEYAALYMLFHKVPAAAFKKGSGFQRDDAFSDKLQEAVVGATKLGLASLFDIESIEGSQYVKPASAVDAAVAKERKAAYDTLFAIAPEAAAKAYPEFAPAAEAEESSEEGTE